MDPSAKKMRQIEESLEKIDERLQNANAYVARNVNVRGSSFLHFADWSGKSGHPLWMKNVVIPRTLGARTRLEKTLSAIENKRNEKSVTLRKRRGGNRWKFA